LENSSAGKISMSRIELGTDIRTKSKLVVKRANELELRIANSRMRCSQLFYPMILD
jgi:hypothetical protein